MSIIYFLSARNPHFNQMFSEPNDESIWKMEMQNDIPGQMSQSLPTTPMTPSPIEDAVPSGSMTTPSTYGAKSSEKNQIDESTLNLQSFFINNIFT